MNSKSSLFIARGYSQLELVMVLALLSLLAFGGLQGWQQWKQQQQLSLTAQQLQNFLLGVRQQAQWYQQGLRLWVIESSTDWCVLASEVPPAITNCPVFEELGWQAPFPAIRFRGMRGQPMLHGRRDRALAGSIEFGSHNQRMRVVISSQGRIRSCRVGDKACV